jgi:nickel/cobalt transporter (NicO) family protein
MIRMVISSVFVYCFIFFSSDALARNPFQIPAQTEEKKEEVFFKPGDFLPGWAKDLGQKAMGRIIVWQVQIRHKAGVYARQIRENPWSGAFWSYLGMAFIYGVIHALGPGHGKAIVSAFFISRKASLRQGVLMSGLMSFLHVLSAVVLVFLFYFIFKNGGMKSVDEAGAYLQKISAGLICLVGLFMAYKSAKAIFKTHKADHASCLQDNDKKGLLSISLAAGLVPCPGAALILFFSITLNILAAGLAAMLFLALGLAVTTVSFALAALFARNILAGLTAGLHGISPILYHLPAMAGALFIAILGAFLLLNPVI